MKKLFGKKTLLPGALGAALLTFRAGFAHAQTLEDLNPTFGDFNTVINHLFDRIPFFLGGLAFFAILYSGAIYVTSLGDSSRMEAAKKNLTWTVIGIIALIAMFAVMRIILWLTNLTMPGGP